LRWAALLLVPSLLSAPACSDDDDAPSTTSSQSSTTSSAPSGPAGSSAGEAASNLVIDVVECDNAGGTVTGSGTLTNGGDTESTFELEIGVHDLDTDALLGSDTVTVGPVGPGEEAQWAIEVTGAGSADVVCRTASATIASG
jgi:hypothetical protein